MKFAYVKNGDAVDQVNRLMDCLEKAPSSGPDAFIADFLRAYSEDHLLVLSRGGANKFYRVGNVEARLFSRNGLNIAKPFMRMLASYKILFHMLRFQPDRILCGSTGSALWVSYLASILLSAPLVHSRHNRVPKSEGASLRRLHASIDNWVIRRAKSVICHGPFLCKQIVDVGVPAEQVFDFDVRFEEPVYGDPGCLPDIVGLKQTDRLLLYVGRIETNKGVFDLLHACREFLEKQSSLKLMYIGDGESLDSLRKQVSETMLGSKVIVAGRMGHSALLAVVQRSFVLVSPTQSRFPEGRCMAAMEGLVMGVPVVAPNFGPFPYLVTHGENGLLFEPDSIKDLKDVIGSIIADDELLEKLSEGARASGIQLSKPLLSFAQAVEKSFCTPGPLRQ